MALFSLAGTAAPSRSVFSGTGRPQARRLSLSCIYVFIRQYFWTSFAILKFSLTFHCDLINVSRRRRSGSPGSPSADPRTDTDLFRFGYEALKPSFTAVYRQCLSSERPVRDRRTDRQVEGCLVQGPDGEQCTEVSPGDLPEDRGVPADREGPAGVSRGAAETHRQPADGGSVREQDRASSRRRRKLPAAQESDAELQQTHLSPQRDLQAEEAGDSESEWEPDPAAAPHPGPAQSPADPQPVWEPDLRVPFRTGKPEASGPAGPVPQPDPERPRRGVRAAGHRDQPQPEPDLLPVSGGLSVSPSEGPPSGGELSGTVLHPSVHPEGLPGVFVLCGGKPVRGEEAQRPGGIRAVHGAFHSH